MVRSGSHAVVLGGSIAGLLTARVLTEHFERVTILERDSEPEETKARKGVPQGHHVHGFWWRGLSYCDRLLPALRDELIRAGALPGDVAADCLWYQYGGAKLRKALGTPAVSMTRPFLEQHIRRRVSALPGAQILHGTTAIGLETDDDRSRVVAVATRHADASQGTLPADFVVDATGRASLTARWLPNVGYEAPEESTVWIDVTYATRYFRRSTAQPLLARIVGTPPPRGKRAGACFAVEGNRWQLTLVGFAGEKVPEDEAGFLEFARSLPVPDLYEIARSSEPLGETHRFKFPSSLRRHYEALPRFPQRLLVIGDALASFNPSYGQGMTAAALEVEALAALLARGRDLDRIAKPFFKRAAAIIDAPWLLSTHEDLRYPEAEGDRPFYLGLQHRYTERVHRAATTDPVVCRAFFEVIGLQRPPAHLLSPNILWRTLLRTPRST